MWRELHDLLLEWKAQLGLGKAGWLLLCCLLVA